MAALEMVMSERLDEHGFEKFFADPPAALVVLQGLRTLAEREVLPSRDPVRGGAAGERATSECNKKKVPSEANDGETQAGIMQEDRIGSMDSGNGNRSQLRDEDFLSHG